MSGTGSLTIGALRTPLDYKKAVQNQDELLRIAIANDMNISEARKLYQSGEPLLPMPQDLKTPSELQSDNAFQEQTAIDNLLKLFPYRDIGTVLANLSQDEKFVLNLSFPEIEQDIKTRFNPKLINPLFFVDYMRRYVEELNASKGVSSNLAFIKNKFDDLTANIEDIKANMPTPSQMRDIAMKLSKKYKRIPMSIKKPIYDRAVEVSKALPDEEVFNNINKQTPNTRFRYLDQIQNLTSNLPPREFLQEVLDRIERGEMSEEEGIMELQNALSQVTPQQIAELQNLKAKLIGLSKKGESSPYEETYILNVDGMNDISGFSLIKKPNPKLKKTPVIVNFKDGKKIEMTQPILIELNKDQQFRRAVGRKINSIAEMASLIKTRGEQIGFEEEELVGIDASQVEETTGSGVYSIARNGKIIGKKIGKGVDFEVEPLYKTFGKYVVHIPQLKHRDLLNVKFRSLGRIPQFKPQPISEVFKDFLLDLLETGKANQRVYDTIPIEERKLFERIATNAGIINNLGLKAKSLSEEDVKDNERFELLKGEYLAGNNSATLLKELRKLVVKFMNSGKISKSTGTDLLIEFSV